MAKNIAAKEALKSKCSYVLKNFIHVTCNMYENKWYLNRIILDMPHNDAKLKSKKNSRRLVNHQQVSEKQPLCEGLI